MQVSIDRVANRSSSMVSSLPEDAPSLETSSPYSSPSSATVPQSGFSPLVGLGISNCGLEASFDNASGFSTPVSYSVPPDILSPNQLVSTPTFYDSSLKPPGFPNEACLSIYTGHPDVSLSPLSFYDSQPMSASPSYNTNLEIQCSPETVHQMPGYWTPTSSASPLEAIATSATSLTSFEQLSEQIQPCISTGTSNLQINPGILPYSAAIGGNEEALIKQEVPFSQNDPYKFINTLSNAGDSSISKRFTKIRTAAAESTAATEKAFSCFTCGMTFTRRSNCREHEKRHDPNLRKSVKCPDCQKIFGRNADLRRHINNIHRQIRKNPCVWCGERFARTEPLEKHLRNCAENPANEVPCSTYSPEEGQNYLMPTNLRKPDSKRQRANSKR